MISEGLWYWKLE